MQHSIVLTTRSCDRLNHKFGFIGLALQWFRSYLEDRSQFVFFNGERSETAVIHYSVPQGSVLGPLYFLLYTYTVDLFDTVTSHGLEVHGYVDDLQICGRCDTGQTHINVFKLCGRIQELDGFKPFVFESR